MSNANPVQSHDPAEFHLIEALVIDPADGTTIFRSSDIMEAANRVIAIRRLGGKAQLAVTLPLEHCEFVNGYVLGAEQERPLSFFRNLPAAQAAATRYTEATGEDISYESAVAFVVPQSAVAWQEPPKATEEKMQQVRHASEHQAA